MREGTIVHVAQHNHAVPIATMAVPRPPCKTQTAVKALNSLIAQMSGCVSHHQLFEAGARTAPAFALATTPLANLQAASAGTGGPQAGQPPHMQVAIGGCMGAEHPPEQKAGVHCAAPATDLAAIVHSLPPDKRPAMTQHG